MKCHTIFFLLEIYVIIYFVLDVLWCQTKCVHLENKYICRIAEVIFLISVIETYHGLTERYTLKGYCIYCVI